MISIRNFENVSVHKMSSTTEKRNKTINREKESEKDKNKIDFKLKFVSLFQDCFDYNNEMKRIQRITLNHSKETNCEIIVSDRENVKHRE